MVKLRKSSITLLALIGYIGLSLEGLVFVAPFLQLPNGHILRTKIHPDVNQEILKKFMDNLPFRSMTYHTVSSGENLVCLIPTSGDQFRMSSSPGHGLRARSSSKAGTLFIRHDQMCVLTYGHSRDHESFMPPVLYVVEEDLPTLLAFGQKAKHCQLEQEKKEPLTLTFTRDVRGMSRGMVGMVGDGGFLNVETSKIVTGNKKVDEVLGLIRAKTREHWLVPPKEVVRLLTTGDAKGLEGTDGYLFPPMVIGNGVLMEFGNYAHSGPINILAQLFEDGITKEEIAILKRFFQKLKDTNLPYLRSLDLTMICDCFDNFFDAWDKAQTVAEVRSLVQAISLFGALMHGWFVFEFPYHFGKELRRLPELPKVPDPFFISDAEHHSFSVPLRWREGRGLGAATFHCGDSKVRKRINPNNHLPLCLRTANFPLLVHLRFDLPKSNVHLQDLAVKARMIIEEHLPLKGAILFRGLPTANFTEASAFITSLGYTIYQDPSGREKVAKGLYHASLSVPKDINIAPHQEHIVSRHPPSKLFLYCQSPSVEGGQTPLVYAGDVWDSLQPETQDQLRRRGVRFEMVRGNAAKSNNPVSFARSWQDHFLTNDLEAAVNKAAEQFDGTVTVDEHDNIILRSTVLQAVKVIEGKEIYHSQLQNIYSLKWLWGDADAYVPKEIVEDVMGAVWKPAVVFPWQAGVAKSFLETCHQGSNNANYLLHKLLFILHQHVVL